MDKQERVLNVFISTIQKKHTAVEMNLKRVRGILSGLRNEIANATKFVDRYQGEERTEAATANLVSGEYTKCLPYCCGGLPPPPKIACYLTTDVTQRQRAWLITTMS
jgi:hypothetical protein